MSPKAMKLLAKPMLFAASLIWGTTFFLTKNTLNAVPVYFLLAIRFSVAALLLGLICWKRWKNFTKDYLWRAGITSTFLFVCYVSQTYGLTMTTPSKSAFLTAVYCVLVPFVNWLLLRRRPTGWNFLAAVMCLGGIGLVSLDGQLTMNRGDALTLVGGLFFALHLVAVGRFGEKDDPVLLTAVQFGMTALCSWVCSLATETAPAALPAGAWAELVYLAVFATTAALLLQNVGQAVTPAAQAAILLSLESVFGVLFSVICYGEAVTPRLALGFALIFLAVVASETRFEFLRRKKAGT